MTVLLIDGVGRVREVRVPAPLPREIRVPLPRFQRAPVDLSEIGGWAMPWSLTVQMACFVLSAEPSYPPVYRLVSSPQ